MNKSKLILKIPETPNTLQTLGIQGVTCPKCGSNNIMHWGLEEAVDAETNESYGFDYTYECRENSPYHNNKPYMWHDDLMIKPNDLESSIRLFIKASQSVDTISNIINVLECLKIDALEKREILKERVK